jgi:hypothetical protein
MPLVATISANGIISLAKDGESHHSGSTMTSHDSTLELRTEVLLTFQVALLGMVTANLRAVTVSWTATRIEGHLHFDGAIGEAEEEIASDVEAEIMASFPNHEISVTAQRCDPPQAPNLEGGEAWVYGRRE